MKYLNVNLLIVLLAAFLLLAGCGPVSQGYTYHSDLEVPQGAGLFTGESGEYVIYRK